MEYLKLLKLSKRSPQTLKVYENVLDRYARFIGVPLEELQHHLTADHLIDYADSLQGRSDRGVRLNLSVIHRYYTVNGVKLGTLETNVLNPPVTEPLQDKPLTLELLQKMMDVADVRGKAIITVLISTGMRPGECSRLVLADYDGKDTITIPNRIAKNQHGGKVYLTTEAREFLQIFLKERDEYVRRAHSKKFSHGNPDEDERLFGLEYSMLCNIFKRLYRKVDGERGKYRDRITVHSTRKYFRTQLVKTCPLDIVEKILRHEGYLSGSYVRITDSDVRAAFINGQDALFITRRDRRQSDTEISRIREEKDELAARINLLEKIVKRSKRT